MEEDYNNYNITNFIYDKEPNSQYNYIEHSAIKSYIISSSDFEKSQKYLDDMKNNLSSEDSINISCFSSSFLFLEGET